MVSDFYDRIFPFTEKKGKFLKTLRPDSYYDLLDIGCATGELVFFMEGPGISAVGIDIDENLINIALEKKKGEVQTQLFF